MLDFFKFGSKGSTKAKASTHSPKGPKKNTVGARNANEGQAPHGFGECLVQGGTITPPQLEKARSIHNRSGLFLGQILVALGYLDRDTMIALLKEHCDISCVQLADGQVDEKVAGLIPQDVCQAYTLVAIGKNGADLTVAMADPLDKTALTKVRRACSNVDITPVLCERGQIEDLHAALYGSTSMEATDMSVMIRDAWHKQTQETPPRKGQIRLGELLVTNRAISQEQCDKTLAYQVEHGGFLGECLVKLGSISQDRLTCFLVKQLRIPYINLSGYEIQRGMLALLPKELCLVYCLVPLDLLGRTLTVAMVNPFDTEAIEEIGKLHPEWRVKPMVCTWKDFKAIAAKEFFRDGDKSFTLDSQKPKV